jgi:23S rRNA (uracil1939-C5)-methyltransferase
VVYVSCNPGTLARDLGVFARLGWATVRVRPFDMFPHTPHVECVVTLLPLGEPAADVSAPSASRDRP